MDELSPAVFAPVVRQFALARPMAVRHLAAQALAPLVTPAQLGLLLEDILESVPCSPPVSSHNEVCGTTEPPSTYSRHMHAWGIISLVSCCKLL